MSKSFGKITRRIKVVDNFEEIGKDNFTRLALSALKVLEKSKRSKG